MFEFVPVPTVGRVFDGSTSVRLGDSSPGGRARLDSLARVLQDFSDDDARDAGFGDFSWVVRRTAIGVRKFPQYLERLHMRTWCSGFGAAWAERRISVTGDSGAALEAATLWVLVDPESMRPTRIPSDFFAVFGPSARGRKVTSKSVLSVYGAPTDAATERPTVGRSWPLRFVDFDVLGHVNNSVFWVPVEEELATRRSLRAPMVAVIEHGEAIERSAQVTWSVVEDPEGNGFRGWLTGNAGEEHAAVSVSAGFGG